MDWKFNEDRTRIILDKPPRSPKRITATRLGGVLGLDPWNTPFKRWCEIVKVYKEPFIENEYVKAGKVIEPILVNWAREQFETGVVSPEEFYGNLWPKVKKQYNFYPNEKVFGGMWDAKVVDKNNKTYAVIEIKTTSRPQDWVDGVPDEKLLQALQYAHLEGSKKTVVIVAFLEDADYMNPHRFVPREGENVKMYIFDTESATIMFDGQEATISELMEYAQQWWDAYVRTGISPEFGNGKDKDILKVLKTQKPDLDIDKDLRTIIDEIEKMQHEIEVSRAQVNLDEKEQTLKDYKDALKNKLQEGMAEEDEKVEVGKWSLSKSVRTSVDTKKMKDDGIYENYMKESVTYTLRETKEK